MYFSKTRYIFSKTTENFSKYFKGVTFNFPLNILKKTENGNFSNLCQIKKREQDLLKKNEWVRRWWQNFRVWTNFPDFFRFRNHSKFNHMVASQNGTFVLKSVKTINSDGSQSKIEADTLQSPENKFPVVYDKILKRWLERCI